MTTMTLIDGLKIAISTAQRNVQKSGLASGPAVKAKKEMLVEAGFDGDAMYSYIDDKFGPALCVRTDQGDFILDSVNEKVWLWEQDPMNFDEKKRDKKESLVEDVVVIQKLAEKKPKGSKLKG